MSMTDDNPTGPSGTPADGGQLAPAPSQPTFEGPEWLGSLSEDLKTSKSLGKFKDVENLARGYVNAEQLLGRDKLAMPKTDDEFKAVYAKLGCPEDPTKYGIDLKTLGVEMDERTASLAKKDLDAFLPVAKDLGLNTKQASELFKFYASNVQASTAASEADIAQETTIAEQTLRRELGQAYDAKISLANRALSSFGSKELISAIDASGLGRNTDFVRMMIKVGEGYAEEMGIDKNGQQTMTPSDLQAEISKAQANPAYLDGTHPEHRKAVEKVAYLFEQLVKR